MKKNYRSRYPVNAVAQDFNNIWAEKYSTPLKYIGGFHELTFPITIYAKNHPINIMDTFGYKNIWIDENDLKKSGAFIFARNYKDVIKFTKTSCPYLPKDFKIKPKKYILTVHNALNMPRDYEMHYFIVPPNYKY